MYKISFTKNDLNMSIISTTFNDFECMLYSCRKQIKTCIFAFMRLTLGYSLPGHG